ncbi:MAG: epoxyqueuosine reductase QueH [Clostridia bacterium]|nr:epoxyqueuosine reductase QueH [Clostridia bacterium]
MKKNYSLVLEQTLKELTNSNSHPSLLLHACCAPCSSYVLEYLADRFDLSLFFYNPNISPKEEYDFREQELCRLVRDMHLSDRVGIIHAPYLPEEFNSIAEGLESEPEGGSRCFRCYRLRLSKAAEEARKRGFDYFTTTLSISPYKNADWLNEIGKEEADIHGVRYLFSDFKKKNGYKRSCELSAEYGLYRQDYCGCIHSKRAAEQRKEKSTS